MRGPAKSDAIAGVVRAAVASAAIAINFFILCFFLLSLKT
jgi:hypothetical protein